MLQGQNLIAHHLVYNLLGLKENFGMLEEIIVRKGESVEKSASVGMC